MRNFWKLVMIFAMMSTVDTDSKLRKVIGEVSSVARFVNGIAIQNGLSERPEEVDEVMDELLDVRGLGQLAGIDADRVSKELRTFRGSVKGIAALRTQNVTRLEGGIRLLEEMKGSADILQSGAVNDTSSIVKNAAENQEEGFKTNLKTDDLKAVLKLFTTISTTEWNNVKNSMNQKFQHTKKHLRSFLSQVKDIQDYKNKLVNLLKLEKAGVMLKGNIEFGNVSRLFSDNLQTFTSVHTDLVSVSDDINDIASLPSGDIGSIAGSLKKMSDILKNMNSKGKRRKTFTASFTNGNKDVKLIEKDLETSQLLKFVSNGKDLSIFKSSLKQLMKFSEGVGKLEVELKKVDGKSREKFEKMTMLMSKAAENIGLLPQVENLKTSLNTIKGCVKDIKAPTASFNHTQFRTMAEFSKNVSEKVGEYRKMLEGITGNKLKSIIDGLNSTYYTIEPFGESTKESKVRTTFENIKSNMSNMPTDLENLKTGLENLDNLKIFEYISKHDSWDLMGDVLQSLDGTKLPEALKCLQQASYDASGVGGVLSLRSSIEEVKNNEDVANSVVATLTHLSAIKKGMVKVKSSTGKKTRRRRDTNLHFRSAQQVSLALGRGIGTLRSYDEILKNEGTIDGLLNADQSVHAAAESASAIWTDSLRNKLQNTLRDLKKLDDYAGSLPLEDTWNVFQEAGKIEGVNIDATLLEDPIAKTLQNDSDATVQFSASSFQSMSQLDLAFTHHKMQLVSAAMTLAPIRSFFDEFMRTKESGEENKENNGSSVWIIIICVSVVAIVILLAVLGYLCNKNRKQKKKEKDARQNIELMRDKYWADPWQMAKDNKEEELWAKRERYWIYDVVRFSHASRRNTILTCFSKNDSEGIKALITKGAHLDIYDDHGLTPLHVAVLISMPDLVEAFIRGGADRTLLNVKGQTAEEMGREWQMSKKDPSLEIGHHYCSSDKLLKECLDIFDKLKAEKFKHAAPRPLQQDKFCIRLGVFKLIEDAAFNKSFPQISYTWDDRRMDPKGFLTTHDVFDTNNNGVLNLDELLVSYLDGRSELLDVVFGPTVLVRSDWLLVCTRKKDGIQTDYQYRVKTIQFEGVIYENVDEWKRWLTRKAPPFSLGMKFFYTAEIKRDDPKIWVPKEVAKFEELKSDSIKPEYIRQPFWFPDKRPIVIMTTNKEGIAKLNIPKKYLDACEIMNPDGFIKYLLSLPGPTKLEEQLNRMHRAEDKKKAPKGKEASKSKSQSLETKSVMAEPEPLEQLPSISDENDIGNVQPGNCIGVVINL